MGTRNQLVLLSISVGLVACLLTWLLMTDTSSPLHDYLTQNPGLRNFWGFMIFPVLAVSILFGLPSSDWVGYPMVFLQWSLITISLASATRTFIRRRRM